MAELQGVIEYIDANLKEEISIAALADMAGYSPWHFYRVFGESTGKPVMEYIRTQRLRAALDELTQGRKMCDIAVDYGFATQAGFCKAFQRQFGCSPTEYKEHEMRNIKREFPAELVAAAEGTKEGGNMSEKLIIRLFREDDADDLWENIYSRNTPKEVKQRIASYLKAYAEGKAVPLAAEVDGHVIGTTYMKFNEHPCEAHIGTLFDIVVSPLFWRMGIARGLVEECKARAIECGKTMLCVSARGGTTAETVYGKLGFIEYGRLPGGFIESWGEHDVYDDVLFYMPLTDGG